MIGGADNDTDSVTDPGDRVAEAVGEGFDTAFTTVDDTFSGAADIEQRAITRDARVAAKLAGNALNNQIVGGSLDDGLDDGPGTDTLDGGAGSAAGIGASVSLLASGRDAMVETECIGSRQSRLHVRARIVTRSVRALPAAAFRASCRIGFFRKPAPPSGRCSRRSAPPVAEPVRSRKNRSHAAPGNDS